jgi:hypothetical protein
MMHDVASANISPAKPFFLSNNLLRTLSRDQKALCPLALFEDQFGGRLPSYPSLISYVSISFYY